MSGFRELAHGSQELFDRILESVSARFLGVAEDVGQQTRQRLPVVSGALAASLTVKPVKTKTKRGAKTAMGKARVPYAGWIEFGGKGRPYVPAGRYLFPTAVQTQGRVEREAADAAETEIRRTLWPTPRT